MYKTLDCAKSAPHCTYVRVASIYWPHAQPSPAACQRISQARHLVHSRTKVMSQVALHIYTATQTVSLNSPLEQHGGLTTMQDQMKNVIIYCIR